METVLELGPSSKISRRGFPQKKAWYYTMAEAKEQGSSQVQQWVLLHSGPLRAHLFARLDTRAVCGDPCMNLGKNAEERIPRLHWMVQAVVHIQQFINKRNVKY